MMGMILPNYVACNKRNPFVYGKCYEQMLRLYYFGGFTGELLGNFIFTIADTLKGNGILGNNLQY